MRVIENKANFPKELVCKHCTSILEIDKDDMHYEQSLLASSYGNTLTNYTGGKRISAYITCPCCNAKNYL